jgi:valyl-tRNA synthetase
LKASVVPADDAARTVLEGMSEHIKRLARINDLEFVETLGSAKGAARAVFSGAELAVPLEGLVDFDKERARLEKELGKLTNELAGLEKRLGNPDFIARAAAEVVAESKARSSELADQIARLRATIDSL